ncbi:MAG: hypothetical protein PHW99_00055 [Rhodoferax sp.]|nr:hypothetical protein [Rhodoferax sp.]
MATTTLVAAAFGFTADAFTDDLLAGFSCTGDAFGAAVNALTAAVFGLDALGTAFSSARECTGLAVGNPISCKSETNICHPVQG